MAVVMKITGINHTVRFITRKKLQVDTGISEGIIKGANELKSEVKESIRGNRAEPRSVDTGAFLKSIEVGTSEKSATVFTETPYAKFLEYGTIKIPERRHFRNSIDRNREKIVNITKDIIKRNLTI